MKILKYVSLALGLFLVTAVGFFLYSVSKLPDPIAIKQKLKSEESSPELQNEVQKEITEEVDKLSEAVEPGSTEGAVVEAKPKSSNTTEEIMRIVKEDFKDIRVCENLSKPTVGNLSPEVMFQSISDSTREDSSIESFRISIKNIFQSKPVAELFSEIESVESNNLQGEEKSDYLKKVGFYSFAAKKAYEIYSNKAEYEEMGDRSYHLYVISQIARKKPELAQDKNVLDFCNQLEASIGEKSKTNIDEERKELVKLIEYAGMTPKELGFNPAVRTKFQLEMKEKSISFGLTHPGMDKL